MYEYTCAYCGKVVQVAKEWQVQRFCNKSCAVSYRNKMVAGKNPVPDECIYQPESIMCGKRKCSKCGWNPEVAKSRLEAIAENPFVLPKPKSTDHYGEWISCDERLPKDREQVLAYTQTGKVMSLHCKNGQWCATSNVQISHWMPMPEGPKV